MEIQPITNTSREKQGFDGECPGGDNLEEARVQRTRGEHYNILLYTRKKKGDGKSESNATISIPCRRTHIEKKRKIEITGIHKHEKGINAAKGETLFRRFGHAKAVRCYNCLIGNSRTGTPTLGERGAPGIVLCFVLFTSFFQ